MMEKKIEFNRRLKEVREHLPYRYGTAVRVLYPELSLQKLHNVMNAGTLNWDVLVALEELADRQKKIFKKK